MSGFADERQAIETFFNTGWTSVGNGVDLFFEEESRSPREGVEYVRVVIRSARGKQLFVGEDTHRYAGVVVVHVFTPKGKGTSRARQIADDVSTVLRRQTTSTGNSGKIEFLSPYLTYPESDGDWHRINVATPYRRDVTL